MVMYSYKLALDGYPGELDVLFASTFLLLF